MVNFWDTPSGVGGFWDVLSNPLGYAYEAITGSDAWLANPDNGQSAALTAQAAALDATYASGGNVSTYTAPLVTKSNASNPSTLAAINSSTNAALAQIAANSMDAGKSGSGGGGGSSGGSGGGGSAAYTGLAGATAPQAGLLAGMDTTTLLTIVAVGLVAYKVLFMGKKGGSAPRRRRRR